jgi:NAD(P)-dependent dehydrogenase (short-subunit alcohol dehydrogenase family)
MASQSAAAGSVAKHRPVAIVTGAGSGIGAAVAQRLSQRFDLVLVGRRRHRLEQTLASMHLDARNDALALDLDITQPGAARAIVEEAVQRFGRIDALVNNAASARFGSLASTAASDDRLLFDTNVLAPISLIREAVPKLRLRRGAIINIGSIGGLLSLPNRAAYGASKAAVHHVTRSLARELAPEIRVNAVACGAVDTEIYGSLGLSVDETQALRSELLATTPLQRLGTTDDVVPWIEMLLSPAGAWVTGSIIVIDGGRSC